MARWASLDARLGKDEDAFATAVAKVQAAAMASVSRDVIRETKKTERGRHLMGKYMITSLLVHDHKSPKTAKLTLDALVDDTLRASSAASGWAGGGGAE